MIADDDKESESTTERLNIKKGMIASFIVDIKRAIENESLKIYHNNILKFLADLRDVFPFDDNVNLGAIVSSPTECLLKMIKECEHKKLDDD